MFLNQLPKHCHGWYDGNLRICRWSDTRPLWPSCLDLTKLNGMETNSPWLMGLVFKWLKDYGKGDNAGYLCFYSPLQRKGICFIDLHIFVCQLLGLAYTLFGS